jgi:HEPN domain-containing protein
MFDFADYSACGRFCEQSAEKSLKAYLEIYGEAGDMRLFSLHKPKRLYERCCELGLETAQKQMASELALFAEYYYDTNYPGDSFLEVTREQAEDAMRTMAEVNSLVFSKLADDSAGRDASELDGDYTRVRLGSPTAICGRTEETSITDSRLW